MLNRKRSRSEPNREFDQTKQLPIFSRREEIIKALHSNQVVIVAGDTGCGKSTQVPKYIYESFRDARVVMTQPRRLAAISIATRISKELNVRLGEEVGYHVGMNMRCSDNTSISVLTTGIFLEKIIHLEETEELAFTHVILDEVHERDIDIDFVMMLMKMLLFKQKKLKLIIMSATISTELFSQYFSPENIAKIAAIENTRFYKNKLFSSTEKKGEVDWSFGYVPEKQEEPDFGFSMNTKPASIVRIDQKMFPVTQVYLEEIMARLEMNLTVEYFLDKPQIGPDLYSICTALISKLHREFKDTKTILVFLPGQGEISSLRNSLENSDLPVDSEIELHVLHSNVRDQDQSKIFDQSKKRKVILSTNIAESSITIPDTYTVIDFCLIKELKFSTRSNKESLQLSYCSKASCEQRKGRAGRVGSGICFRLLSQNLYNKLPDFSKPELKRISLEKVILKLKVWDYLEPDVILSSAIEPPSIGNIENAIINLVNYGALAMTEDSVSGKLTDLGRIYAELPVDLKHTRLLIYGCVFGFTETFIYFTAILSQEKSLFQEIPDLKRLFEVKKDYDMDNESDLIMTYNLIKDFEYTFLGGKKVVSFSRGYFRRMSYNMKQWLRERFVRSSLFADICQLAADLHFRVIDKLQINIADDLKINGNIVGNTDNSTIIKIAIGAAFHQKLVKCRFDELDKVIQNKLADKQINTKKTVTIRAYLVK